VRKGGRGESPEPLSGPRQRIAGWLGPREEGDWSGRLESDEPSVRKARFLRGRGDHCAEATAHEFWVQPYVVWLHG
jgi:hypothetical protein